MNLASETPSTMVLDVRNVTFFPDNVASDLVIMAQADYAIALGNNMIAGILIGLGIATIIWVSGLAIYNAIESRRDPHAKAFRRQRAEIAAWQRRRELIIKTYR